MQKIQDKIQISEDIVNINLNLRAISTMDRITKGK